MQKPGPASSRAGALPVRAGLREPPSGRAWPLLPELTPAPESPSGKRGSEEPVGTLAGKLRDAAVGLLWAMLFAFPIAVTLVGLATLYGWYNGIHYPEGTMMRSLEVGMILFVALTGGFFSERREERSSRSL